MGPSFDSSAAEADDEIAPVSVQSAESNHWQKSSNHLQVNSTPQEFAPKTPLFWYFCSLFAQIIG
jgi:hypothetical protein